MDRRIPKTREAIHGAFIALLSEKNFKQITVNEIAERANVNRATVYLHYADKYDLLERCVQEGLERVFQSCLPQSGGMPGALEDRLLLSLRDLERQSAAFSALLANEGVPAFRERMLEAMKRGLDERLPIRDENLKLDKEVLTRFLSSAVVGVLEWWIAENMTYPAERLAAELAVLVGRHG
ncbi:TetR/AcrR family transcriptional regulator [Saccharibacillus sp. CPCC 101409]|uniref:TetR/AcrR family transcriptional regulator n=1 Tax=Saccharibacillus sp. CPCC 101409 TaxID=3058041 RepID=UPI002672E4FD|nr:TetR/AcrR family transcriptional regulator [Saccharibacillus sp. CPCC 101409]MDO3412311.1 TetR/AcrR family transcriptional regulator [Saccharibacillus sp. CPCC 101409]